MVNPRCLRCGGVIPSGDVNVERDVAFCRPCNLVYELSELASPDALVPEVDLAHPPHGCWHRPDAYGVMVGATHRSLGTAAGLLAASLFWNGIVSVFVLLAIAATLKLMGVTAPEWFPTPKMNGENMGVGMTIFLWIFLTPFMVIGAGMTLGLLSSLGGRTEVGNHRGEAWILTAIGPLGWKRRFPVNRLKNIRIEHRRSRDSDGDVSNKVRIVAELNDGRCIRFGSMLTPERRRYLASAATRILSNEEPALRHESPAYSNIPR